MPVGAWPPAACRVALAMVLPSMVLPPFSLGQGREGARDVASCRAAAERRTRRRCEDALSLAVCFPVASLAPLLAGLGVRRAETRADEAKILLTADARRWTRMFICVHRRSSVVQFPGQWRGRRSLRTGERDGRRFWEYEQLDGRSSGCTEPRESVAVSSWASRARGRLILARSAFRHGCNQ